MFLKKKINTFGSLISLIALSAMLVVFFLSIPDLIVSPAGRIFVGIWALMAVFSFIAHGRNLTGKEERQYVPVFGIQKAGRTTKRVRPTSSIRGL